MNNSMPELTFKELLNKNKMIVPEIQREYVWGNNPSILQKFTDSIAENTAEDKGYNIGFLYSYTPNYAKENEDKQDKICYLIDGQQRFTTLYLLAFYYAIKEGGEKKEEYNKITNKFSYRVRVSTSEFLEKMVDKITCVDDFNNIQERTWFLSHYHKDPSIKTILAFYKWLEKCTSELTYDEIMKVSFFNFNIDETGQGEELYITMNSRGEQLEDNEKLRAYLLGEENFSQETIKKSKHDWAKEYDNWQEYFWKHRGSNADASNGFNEFIRWVLIIEFTKLQDNENSKDSEKLKYSINYSSIEKNNIEKNLGLFCFSILSKYFEKLENTIDFFNLNNSADLEKYKGIKNHYEKDWLSGKIANKGYMFLLPLLSVCVDNDNIKIGDVNFILWVRFFYNIAFNKESTAKEEVLSLSSKIKKHKEISDVIDLIDDNGVFVITSSLLDEEERTKLQQLKLSKERGELEKVFQKLEDHPILAGCIKPFIDHSLDEGILNLSTLKQYSEIFYQCFPIEVYDNTLNLVRRALLTCGDYPIWSGNTNNKGGRYSFCSSKKDWNSSFEEKATVYFKLFDRLRDNKPLIEIIDEYHDEHDYYYTVIKNSDVLEYSYNKFFSWDWSRDQINCILEKKKASEGLYLHIELFQLGYLLKSQYRAEFNKEQGVYTVEFNSINFFIHYKQHGYENYSLWTERKNQEKLKSFDKFKPYDEDEDWLVISDLNTEQDILNVIQKIKDHIMTN